MKKKLAMLTLLLATTIAATGCNDNEVKPMETEDGKSIILVNNQYSNFDEIFNILSGLFYDIKKGINSYISEN